MFKNIMDDTQLQKRIFEENVKDKLTEDELKTLNADLEKITEIEKKVAELKNQN
mgnify:CR=1 FL=1